MRYTLVLLTLLLATGCALFDNSDGRPKDGPNSEGSAADIARECAKPLLP